MKSYLLLVAIAISGLMLSACDMRPTPETDNSITIDMTDTAGDTNEVSATDENIEQTPSVDDTSTAEANDATDASEATPAIDLSTIEITGNGTEPFWSLNASGSSLQLLEPSQSGPMIQTVYATTMSVNGSDIIISDGASITVTVTPQNCSDGMSELTYTHKAKLERNGNIWYGCANIAP